MEKQPKQEFITDTNIIDTTKKTFLDEQNELPREKVKLPPSTPTSEAPITSIPSPSVIFQENLLGSIEWDKEKYKDALFQTEEQITGKKIKISKAVEELKDKGIIPLNGVVLEYLRGNEDKIPVEWEGKTIVFLGTLYKEIEASTGASGALALQLHGYKEKDSKSPSAKFKWNEVSVTDYDELGGDVFFAVQPK